MAYAEYLSERERLNREQLTKNLAVTLLSLWHFGHFSNAASIFQLVFMAIMLNAPRTCWNGRLRLDHCLD